MDHMYMPIARSLAETQSKSTGSATVSVLAVIAALALSVLFVLLFYYIYMRRRAMTKKKTTTKRCPSQRLVDESCTSETRKITAIDLPVIRVFTFKQLQTATNNFSEEHLIGHGRFGSIFKGSLEDGRIAAVKQLCQNKQGDFEFRVEIDMLSNLHSPYLLGLIGYCADQDHRLLVYNYMSNGSLQEHLYPKGTHSSASTIDWETRLRIALDSARGLEYLHESVDPPVIHRAFKSSNILLDENFNAKVSDFGLAKLGSDKIDGLISTQVMGTHGYVAPEYAMTGHLTTKSDVYSYGVVLLELITGRAPIDMKRPSGEGVLVSWALPRLTDRTKLGDMVDPKLEGMYIMKDLIQVAAIAAMCVQPEADYRPLMTDVAQSLIPLVKSKNRPKTFSTMELQHQVVTIHSPFDSANS